MVRTMVRIKALYRGRGIRTPGSRVYQPSQRELWLKQLNEAGLRQRAGWLLEELDQLRLLRKQAKHAMLRAGSIVLWLCYGRFHS